MLPDRTPRLFAGDRLLALVSSVLGLSALFFFFALVFLVLCSPFSLRGVPFVSLRHYEKPLVLFVALWGLRLVLVNIKARKLQRPQGDRAETLDLSAFDARKWWYACALAVIATLVNWRHFYFSLAAAGYPEYLNLADIHVTKSLAVNIIVNKVSVVLLAMAIYMACKEFVGQTCGVVGAVLCLFYPLNNSNMGLFAVENIFIAGCLFAVYLATRVVEKGGANGYLLMGAALICFVLHPIGYVVIAVILLLVGGTGGLRSPGRYRVFAALGAAVLLSGLWYVLMREPVMGELGTTFRAFSAIKQTRMVSHYGKVMRGLSPYLLISAVMLGGLIVSLAPGAWPDGGNAATRRVFIVGCSLLFSAVGYAALSADAIYFNYLALVMPFWYILAGVAIAWLLTCKIFSADVLDRNLSILLSIFLLVILVTRYNKDSEILRVDRFPLRGFYFDRGLGKKVKDAKSSTGYCFSIPAGGREGYAVFGPYDVLFPGKYQCEFLLKLQSAEPEAQTVEGVGEEVARLDVSASHGRLALGTRTIGLQEMKPAGEYRGYSVECELSSVEQVEFRVWTKGKAGLCFDSVRVSRRPAGG